MHPPTDASQSRHLLRLSRPSGMHRCLDTCGSYSKHHLRGYLKVQRCTPGLPHSPTPRGRESGVAPLTISIPWGHE
eukprot:6542752-Alexandrium_andersonii.AAC.1